MIRRLVLAGFLVLATLPPNARAESSDDDTPRLSTSLSVWRTSGNTTWSHDASAAEPRFGNPTSRLEYDNIDSTVVELRGRVDLPAGIFAELAYGTGEADGGTLTDTDFASARGAEAFGTTVSGAHAYSETVSILDGDSVRYFDARAGKEMLRSRDERFRGGLAARYLHWTEQYSARGVNQTICTAPDRLCLPQGTVAFRDRNVIFNDMRWRALFIGVWGRHRLSERLHLSADLAYSPLADLSSDDRHVLRADLAQDPSFRLEGQGQAATARIEATYHFSPRLAAALGLRYWWMAVRDEARGFTAFPAGGAPFSAPLNRFESERYGVTLSISYALGAVDQPAASRPD